MKSHHAPILAAFIIVLILILGFFFYGTYMTEEIEESGQTYTVEEMIEPEEVTPEELEEIPMVESISDLKEETTSNKAIILINNLRFHPDDLTISPGTIVTWINNDTVPHQVVSYERVFYGPRLEPGDEYSFRFTTTRSHRYFDGVFPKIGRGEITVEEEPLPITGGVIAASLENEEHNAKLALLVILAVITILGLGHGMHKHEKNKEK